MAIGRMRTLCGAARGDDCLAVFEPAHKSGLKFETESCEWNELNTTGIRRESSLGVSCDV